MKMKIKLTLMVVLIILDGSFAKDKIPGCTGNKQDVCKVLNQRNQDLEACEEEKAKLQDEVDALKKQVQELENENKALETENQKLKDENQKLKEENEDLKKQNQDLKDENKELKKQNQDLKDEIEELKKQNRDLQDENEELKKQNQDLQDENEELKKQNQDLQNEIEDLKKQNQDLQDENEQLKKKNQDMNDEIEDLKKQNQALKDENENLKKENQELKDQIAAQKETIDELNRKIEDLKKQLEECESKPTGPPPPPAAKSCLELQKSGKTTNGVYSIDPDGQGAFDVYCDQTSQGGGWAVIQRRKDGSTDFSLGWNDYKNGFGQFGQEWWLGLDKIHRITSQASDLRIGLTDQQGNSAQALYNGFSVGAENTQYVLTSGRFAGGTAGDSMSVHNGRKFSTKDRDNDLSAGSNCAVSLNGGWWYYGVSKCADASLNGQYGKNVFYRSWKGGAYSLKGTAMRLRPN